MDFNNRNGSFSWSGSFTEDISLRKKKAKKTVMRPAFALAAFLAVSYLAVFVISLLVSLVFNENAEEILYSPYYNMVLNVVAMYLLAFPVFLIVAGKRPEREKLTREKIGIKELLMFFLMAEGCMFVGSLLGNFLSRFIGNMLGGTLESSLEQTLSETPMWLILLVAVIIGPIVEELMFRKALIDRLSSLGEGAAIILSALAFGLFHTNFYQFFYAFFIGLILGYLYVKTHNVLYTVVIHITVNFLGSIVTMYITELAEYLEPFHEMPGNGTLTDAYDYLFFSLGSSILNAYTIIQYGLFLGGVALIIGYVRKGKFKIKANGFLTPKEKAKCAVCNAGSITFLLLCAVLFVLDIISSLNFGG